jgi:hypothetical protein
MTHVALALAVNPWIALGSLAIGAIGTVPAVINNPNSTWARRVMMTLFFALLPILIPLALIDLITQPIWRAPKAFRLQ